MVGVELSADTFKRLHDQFVSFGADDFFEKEMVGDAKMILLLNMWQQFIGLVSFLF